MKLQIDKFYPLSPLFDLLSLFLSPPLSFDLSFVDKGFGGKLCELYHKI